MRSLALSLSLLTPLAALAGGWDERLAESAHVALVEVVAAGEVAHEVRVVERLRGDAPDALFVYALGGFEGAPPAPGDRYYAFLTGPREPGILFGPAGAPAAETALPAWGEAVAEGRVFHLWGREAGLLSVSEAGVVYDLLPEGDLHQAAARSPEALEAFLRAAFDYRDAGAIDEGFLDERQRHLEAGADPALAAAELALCGEVRPREAYQALAEGGDARARLAVTDLLADVVDPAAAGLRVGMLDDADGDVQRGAFEALVSADPALAGLPLMVRLAALEGQRAASGDGGQRHRLAAERRAIIRLLGEMGVAEAAQPLAARLTATTDPWDYRALLDATYALGDPRALAIARARLATGPADLVGPSAELVRRVGGGDDALAAALARSDLGERARLTVVAALGAGGGPSAGPALTGLLRGAIAAEDPWDAARVRLVEAALGGLAAMAYAPAGDAALMVLERAGEGDPAAAPYSLVAAVCDYLRGAPPEGAVAYLRGLQDLRVGDGDGGDNAIAVALARLKHPGPSPTESLAPGTVQGALEDCQRQLDAQIWEGAVCACDDVSPEAEAAIDSCADRLGAMVEAGQAAPEGAQLRYEVMKKCPVMGGCVDVGPTLVERPLTLE